MCAYPPSRRKTMITESNSHESDLHMHTDAHAMHVISEARRLALTFTTGKGRPNGFLPYKGPRNANIRSTTLFLCNRIPPRKVYRCLLYHNPLRNMLCGTCKGLMFCGCIWCMRSQSTVKFGSLYARHSFCPPPPHTHTLI